SSKALDYELNFRVSNRSIAHMQIVLSLPAFLLAVRATAQFTPGGQTQPGLPAGCVGSWIAGSRSPENAVPDMKLCETKNWYLGEMKDQCAPLDGIPRPGQQVYIKDSTNFCINLPNPDSIFLKNNFYDLGKLPNIVQAEGFVQSFCMGDYLPSGAKKLPANGIRAAHVVKNFSTPGQHYYQIHGYLDCEVLGINCTMPTPGAYDDAGQYDDAPFINCGKEPYSGVDNSTTGNPGFQHYVEMAGNAIFCMRVCEPGNLEAGRPCDVRHDRDGCEKFMQVTFKDGFTYTDLATGQVSSASVSLAPRKTTTTTTATTTTTTTKAAAGATGGASGSASVAVTSSKPSGSERIGLIAAVAVIAGLISI
ncbi:hypothetical protein BC830DRAFT_1087243, partial [Chytriomyces sp. MP71]